MTRRIPRLIATSALVLASGSGTARAQSSAQPAVHSVSPEVLEVVRSIYEYNRKASTRVDTLKREDRPAYTRQKLVFAPPLQPPVPAFLAIPKRGTPPFPVVVLIHGYSGSKSDWFGPVAPVLDSLIQAGIAVLALDGPYHGERAGETGYLMSEDGDLRDFVTRWTVEQRRALDYLSTRPELDPTRIGVMGYSLGAVITFALAGTDARVKAAVACVTPVGILKDPATVSIAPQTFAGALRTTPTLMLMGKQDRLYSEEDARRLFDLIADPRKELTFYDSGHELPPEWMPRATAWLVKHLH